MLRPYAFPHELAIVAIMKNEGDYVQEWLDYHLSAGVTKFYLYDNESDDNTTAILQPYIQRGQVDYTFFPGDFMQMPAYNDALQRHKFDCRYMAAIDLDEFIFPCGGKDIPSTVKDIFALSPGAGGAAINWRTFGSNGHTRKDLSRGVLDRFTKRAADGFNSDTCVKSVVNPRCADIFPNSHFAVYYVGKYAVNELGEVVHTYYSSRFSGQKIQVNHYFTKSQEEFMTKRERGRADIGGRETLEEFKLKDVNDVFDDGIIKYRAFLENRPEAESLHKPKDIIEAMTEFDASLNDGELGGRVDDLLGYWRFCRAELPRYIGKGKRTDYFSEVILAGLSKAFELPQPMWQCELFLSVMPELMLFNRSRVLGILKKIYPFMRDSYRQNFRWHRYEGLELLYNSLSAMEA